MRCWARQPLNPWAAVLCMTLPASCSMLAAVRCTSGLRRHQQSSHATLETARTNMNTPWPGSEALPAGSALLHLRMQKDSALKFVTQYFLFAHATLATFDTHYDKSAVTIVPPWTLGLHIGVQPTIAARISCCPFVLSRSLLTRGGQVIKQTISSRPRTLAVGAESSRRVIEYILIMLSYTLISIEVFCA